MNLAIFYFSATGITETISNHIATILIKEGNAVKLTNIITPDSRQSQFDFSEFDACFFGFPVFGGRIPHFGKASPFFENFVKQTGLAEDVVEQKRSKIIFYLEL